jgi:hypothetical protein
MILWRSRRRRHQYVNGTSDNNNTTSNNINHHPLSSSPSPPPPYHHHRCYCNINIVIIAIILILISIIVVVVVVIIIIIMSSSPVDLGKRPGDVSPAKQHHADKEELLEALFGNVRADFSAQEDARQAACSQRHGPRANTGDAFPPLHTTVPFEFANRRQAGAAAIANRSATLNTVNPRAKHARQLTQKAICPAFPGTTSSNACTRRARNRKACAMRLHYFFLLQQATR